MQSWHDNVQVSPRHHDSQSLCSTHERYSEKMVPDMLAAACELTGASMEQIGILSGRYFVHFMIMNGYGRLD